MKRIVVAVQKVVYTGTGTVPEFNGVFLSKRVLIQDGVRHIDDYAFTDSKATRIIIPTSVTSIGEFAFGDCKKLKKLVIGAGVKKLDEQIANGCKRLKVIEVQTKKLTDKGVNRYCLSESKVKAIKVNVGSKKENRKYIKKYKKIFTKGGAGKNVKVR